MTEENLSYDRIPTEIVFKDKKHSSGCLRDGKIILYISSKLKPEKRQEHINVLTERLIKQYQQAQENQRVYSNDTHNYTEIKDNQGLEKLVREINSTHFNFNVNKIAFHQQNSIWGSCSIREKNIFISHRLKGAPFELLEYVIIHELAHLAVPNHSRNFWALVEKACPNYREIRKRLQLYGAL